MAGSLVLPCACVLNPACAEVTCIIRNSDVMEPCGTCCVRGAGAEAGGGGCELKGNKPDLKA